MAKELSVDEFMRDQESASISVDDFMQESSKPVEGGFTASVKQTVGSTIKGAGQLAADYIPGVGEDNAVKRYGEEVIAANPTAVRSLEDIKDKPWTAVKEATGNAGASVAGVVGARALGMGITAASPLAGPAAPAVALAGQAIAWFGPAAIAALPSYGSIREKQQINDPESNDSWRAKAIASLGAATVGAIETKFGPQEWALSALTKEGRKALAEKFAETTVAKAIGFGALKGAAIEGAEELAQNPIEQLAGYDDPTTPESLKDTAFGGAMGALGGGVFGGGAGAMAGRGQNNVTPQPKPDVQDIGAAQNVDEAIAAADAVVGQSTQDALAATRAEKQRANLEAAATAETERQAKEGDLQAFMESETRNLQVARAQILEESRKARELEQIQQAGQQDLGRTTDQQVAVATAATDEAPTAMQLAMQRALERQAQEQANVSPATPVQLLPAEPAGRGGVDAAPGVAADVGTRTVTDGAVEPGRAADQPTRLPVPPQRGAVAPELTATKPTAGTPQNVQVQTPFSNQAATPARTVAPAEPAAVPPAGGTAANLEAVGIAEPQRDGTALIRGDVQKILAELKKQGFTAVLKRQGGVLVGRSQAQRALEVFKAPAQKVEQQARPKPVELPRAVESRPATEAAKPAPVPTQESNVKGTPIDSEWSAFTPDSGTKGVPRAEMPQIKAEHRGAMTNFLNARGIEHEQVEVPARDLKPTQAEFSPGKVEKAKKYEGGDRSILISSDGHILDGHHQWLAKRDAGENVQAIRLDAPIEKLLTEVKEFPSAKTAEGATAEPDTQQVAEPSKPAIAKETPATEQTAEETPAPAEEKPISQMSAADLLRAAADKMEVKSEQNQQPGQLQSAPSASKTVAKNEAEPATKPAKAEPQKPMFTRSEEGQLPAVINPSTVSRVQSAITDLIGGKQLSSSLGRIVATTAAEIKSTWEPLIGKNVQIGSEGEAGVAQAFFEPSTKTVFMIADHINVGAETAVLAHELMHKHGQTVLGKAGWDRLHGMIGTWKDAAEDSDERFVYDYATRKVQAVGEELSTQELFPYAVEAAIRMGIKPSMQAKRGTVSNWLESVRQNLKVVWGKITGKPDTFKAQDMVDLAFGIAQMENPESAATLAGALDETKAEQNALRALSENDELFALPRSDKTTVEAISAETDPKITVKTTKQTGLVQTYVLTMPDGAKARLMVRKVNPYGPQAYGMLDRDDVDMEAITERPGENAQEVPDDTEDVYIDVSNLKEGGYGGKVYNIAATFAHNTGRILIGDPAGLSDEAMRRRTEHMLSSALKFGTTRHLAPHPRQTMGARDIGVPPMRWTYGDDLGNIKSLIKTSLESVDHAGAKLFTFDLPTGTFRDSAGRVVDESAIRSTVEQGRRSESRAGIATYKRNAVLSALVREEGGQGGGTGTRAGVLAQLVDVGRQHAASTQGIFYSRRVIVGQTNRQHTPAQLRAMRNVGFEVDVPTMKERAQALWQDAGKKLAQGIVDQFAPVKDLDKEAYGLLRLAKGASGAFEVFLRGGKLKLTDGVYDYDEQNKGGVVDKLLIPLQGEHHDFMRWIAANRAERLTAEGRENLFSAQDIADLKTLADGTTDFDYTLQTGPRAGTVTRDRTLIYADAQRVFNGFNKNVLDLAEQSGLIDGTSRHLWESEFYVPFYRVAEEDGGVRGANIKSGVVRQEAFKKLKGGSQELNADLLDNTLMNWAHLLDAAAKNRAAKATIEAAEKLGAATQVPSGTKKSVWFMDKGQKHHAVVDDPYLLTAITALEYAGMRNPVMNAMGTFKHYLTMGVTASPFFKIRNLIRDSMQVVATSGISPNVAANVGKGGELVAAGESMKNFGKAVANLATLGTTNFDVKEAYTDEYFRLMAGGGTIHFGTMLEGSEAKRVQALVESGVDDATILNDENKVKQFYRKFIEPAVTAYNELGNRGEAINRASLYDQLRKQGISHAEASLQARDLMDFSMQGSFTTIRFLTQVVPFFNARLQGMYKLGRAAKEDPKRMAAVIGAVSLVSLSLLAAYGDDDDWKKREEWDRNNYWWFKFGGTAFRIPKPFEIGAMATLAERGFELMFDKEMTGKRFRKQVLTLLSDNLSMNPVPQLVKPILDVYANKDSFTGRPIETMGMDRLQSAYRFTDRTSMLARGASTTANAVTGLVGVEAPSPVQIDHMLRGYFGWLGAFVVGAGDIIARPMTGQPERPSSDIWKAATGGMISDVDSASSRYVSQMYEQSKEIERAYATWRNLVKEGKTLEAGEYLEENRDEIRNYRKVSAVKAQESRLNQRIRMIERSNMAPDKKREQIRQLQGQKDRIARRLSN